MLGAVIVGHADQRNMSHFKERCIGLSILIIIFVWIRIVALVPGVDIPILNPTYRALIGCLSNCMKSRQCPQHDIPILIHEKSVDEDSGGDTNVRFSLLHLFHNAHFDLSKQENHR